MGTIDKIIQKSESTQENAIAFDKDQWKQQKQQELDDTFKLLNDSTSRLADDPSYLQKLLNLLADQESLSAGNALLVLAQTEKKVSQLNNFDAWKKQGRTVKKGETGLRVLVPVNYTRSDGSEGTSFRVSRVFDTHQTEGEVARQPVSEKPDLALVLEAMIRTSPVKVIAADDKLSDHSDSEYDPEEKVIHIRKSLSDSKAFEVLAREQLRVTLYFINKDANPDNVQLPLYCAHYLISQRFGQTIDTEDMNASQLYDWPDQTTKIRSVISDARQSANMLQQRISRGLAEIEQPQQEQKTGRRQSEPAR
jgi:hypothetical protein